MKNIKIFSISLLFTLLFSCINESENSGEIINNSPEQKLYLFDTNTNQSVLVGNASNCLILPETYKLLYQWDGLWSYDISSKKAEVIVNYNIGYFDDYSISPDSKYLVYGSLHKLRRINLLTKEDEILEYLNDEIESRCTPRFSNDGKKLIFLTHPNWRKDLTNFDSLYINLYDFDQAKLLKLDTVLIKRTYPYFVFFTENSEHFFVGTKGYDEDYKIWTISIKVFINSSEPRFLHNLIIHPATISNEIWNGNDETILIWDGFNDLTKYNINTKAKTLVMDLSQYHYYFHKLKNSDYLIGRNYDDNKIMILNMVSKNSVVYQPDVTDNISSYHYVPGYKYIAFRTVKY